MNTCSMIHEDVYQIRGRRSNCYVLAGEYATLVDTGMPGDHEVIVRALREIGWPPDRLQYIIITHAHLDHVGSLAVMSRISGARVIAGRNERPFIEGERMLCSMKREGAAGAVFRIILFVLEKFFQRYEPVRLSRPFDEHSPESTIGGMRIIATPGHSLGSLSLYLAASKTLLAGDALSGVPLPHLPPRAGCSDYAAALRSVERMLDLDFDTCLFGHGDPLIGGAHAKVASLLQASR